MRSIATVEDQSIYDIALEQFGGLDNLYEVIRQAPLGQIDGKVTQGTAMELSDTNNVIAAKFIAEGVRLSTFPFLYSQAAEDVLSRFPSDLSLSHKLAIAGYVDGLNRFGNYFTNGILDVLCFAQVEEDNALTSWKGHFSPSKVNSPTHSNEGFSFNGSTQYIDLNAGLTGSSEGLLVGVFVQNNADESGEGVYLAGSDIGASAAFGMEQNPSSNNVTAFFGVIGTAELGEDGEDYFSDKSMNTAKSSAAGSASVLSSNQSGEVFSDSDSLTPGSATPGTDVYVGANNADGTPAGHFTGVISLVVIGSDLPDNLPLETFNELSIELMESLGVTTS